MTHLHIRRFSFKMILLLAAGFFFTLNGSKAQACEADFDFNQYGNQVHFANKSSGFYSTYFWDFGDGNTSTSNAPGHSYAAAGTYSVSLFLRDSLGCTDSLIKQVVIPAMPDHILGTVYFIDQGQTNIDHGVAYLIQFDSTQNTLTAVDTVAIDSNSMFYFDNIAPGEYLIKAALTSQSSHYNDYMPTYMDTSLFWNMAYSIEIGNNWFTDAFVYLLKGTNPGGPGFIGGNVTQGANKKAGPGDPLEGVSVLLLDMNNKAITSTWTDATGKFEFDNIPLMSYKVWPEIPGKTTDPMIVDLSQDNEEETGLEIFVNTTTVTGIFKSHLAYEPQVLDIYPNPSNGIININHKSAEGGNLQIRLLNSVGQVVLLRGLNAQPASVQSLTLDATALPRGFYYVEVLKSTSGNSASYVQKIVIE
ncbi:MAG: PKD domain-containing protein [Bacteroidia bacterium]